MLPHEDEYRRDFKAVKVAVITSAITGIIQTVLMLAILGSIPHL